MEGNARDVQPCCERAAAVNKHGARPFHCPLKRKRTWGEAFPTHFHRVVTHNDETLMILGVKCGNGHCASCVWRHVGWCTCVVSALPRRPVRCREFSFMHGGNRKRNESMKRRVADGDLVDVTRSRILSTAAGLLRGASAARPTCPACRWRPPQARRRARGCGGACGG